MKHWKDITLKSTRRPSTFSVNVKYLKEIGDFVKVSTNSCNFENYVKNMYISEI